MKLSSFMASSAVLLVLLQLHVSVVASAFSAGAFFWCTSEIFWDRV